MAESLANAQVIGGVVVTIGSDLTGLRAGEREAKAIASNIERTVKVSLPVLFDTSRLVAQAPQLMATAQAAIRALPPIRIPVMLDFSGAAAQMAAARGSLSGGGGFGIPTITSGPAFGGGGLPPLLPGGAATTATAGGPLFLPGRGWTGGPNASTATVTGGGTTQTTAIGRAGGGAAAYNQMFGPQIAAGTIPPWLGGAAAAGGGGPATSAGGFTPDRFLGQIIKGTALIRGTEFFAGSAVNTLNLQGARARGDLSGELSAQQQQEELAVGVGNVFLGAGSAGKAIRDFASWSRSDYRPDNSQGFFEYSKNSFKSLFSGKGELRNNRAAIADQEFSLAQQEKKNARLAALASAGRTSMVSAQDSTRQITLANSLAFATSGESGSAQATFALSEFNRQQGLFRTANNLATDSAEVQAQRAALQQAVKIAGTQQGIERAVFGGRIQAATTSAALGIGGIRAYYAGDSEAAAKAERDAQRVGLVQNQNERVITAADSEKGGLRRANRAELQLFDEQSAKEAFDRQKQRAADLTQTIGTQQAAALTISKEYFKAELAAFDAKTKAELSLIDDVTARQNAAARASAQRAAMVARENQRVGAAVAISTAGTAAAGLRIGHRNDEADLVEFDARAREELSNVADPRERAARERELATQRDLIVQRQNEARTDRQSSLSTRTAQAQSFDRYGVYQPGVAGVIGAIAGYKSELRNAPASDLGQIRSTQIAELQGMQKQLINASAGQYALAFDPRYDAARGGENETVKELKLIREYLSQLLGKNTGAAPSVP